MNKSSLPGTDGPASQMTCKQELDHTQVELNLITEICFKKFGGDPDLFCLSSLFANGLHPTVR